MVIVGRRLDPIYLVKVIAAVNDWIRLPPQAAPAWAISTAKALSGCLDGKPFPELRLSS